MWEGTGWQRTQRQLGVLGFMSLLIGEVFLGVDVPIGMYSLVGGLLGLDLLVEALDGLRKHRP